MGAADLLAYVHAAGFTLDLADDKLLVTPASMLTDELRIALRNSKPEVLALLAAEYEATAEAFCERTIVEFDGGLPRADAEDLVERLQLSDVEADHRTLCLECHYLAGTAATGWRCGGHRFAAVGRALNGDLVTRPQGCSVSSGLSL